LEHIYKVDSAARITKALKQFVEQEAEQQQVLQQQQLAKFKGLPFWVWDKLEHRQAYNRTYGSCCFNHVLGLPQKNGNDMPLFDYEHIVYDTLEQSRYVW
jgi:hypothetical protein